MEVVDMKKTIDEIRDELFCGKRKNFAVARFRHEDVDVLVLECGTACEQVLVPQSEDSRSKVVGHPQPDAQTPHPEGAEPGEQFCFQRGQFHA